MLRALTGDSAAANDWFTSAKANGDRFLGSRMLDIEVTRFLVNNSRARTDADAYLDSFTLFEIDEKVAEAAKAIPFSISGADSVHVATAQLIGSEYLTLVTHDQRMADVAQSLGFKVYDPVTDDPNRGPVTAAASATSQPPTARGRRRTHWPENV